jgi:glucosyl-dolichyl phosphate glucuronosyltransferase
LRITVAICTRNRAEPLSAVLGSFVRLATPAALAWELCVVDNGSSDGTPDVVRGFADRLPIRYVYEGVAGLSNARNRAVREAHGEYICWTDDDVEVDSHWLAAYARAFESHPEGVLFGGRILPRLLPPTPDWFRANTHLWPVQALLAARDFGDAVLPLSFAEGRVPWGANYAVRTDVQRRHTYDPKLGVSPDQRRLGEEAEVMLRVLEEGPGWWTPDAIVHHFIPSGRQSWDYIFRYFVAMGETLAYLESVSPGDNHMWREKRPAPVSASALVLQRRRARSAARYALARLRRDNAAAIDALREVGFFSGGIAFLRQRAR